MGLISRVSSRTYRESKMPPKIQKAKVRDKLVNLSLFDKATFEKFNKEVPGYKIVTASIASERMKIKASLAKRGLRRLAEEGKIRAVVEHASQVVYAKIEE